MAASPLADHSTQHHATRMHSATPPPAPLSKRDKRRQQLTERLTDMVTSFSQHRDQHYRAQLSAIQVDMNLIQRADPYANEPLPDSGEEIKELVSSIGLGYEPQGAGPQADFEAQAGRAYGAFAGLVNEAMTTRDADLDRHNSALNELEIVNHHKIRVAQEEHRILANSLRERLIQNINQRRARLLKEKEQLDIGDTSALLLHPSQFSIAGPGSPGGPQNNRKTRHTRHRIGEADESVEGGKKRKRNAFAEDNDVGSPAPTSRALDFGYNSPFKEARAKTIFTQSEAPAYSVERLFTEKELTMAQNTAARTTAAFFAKLKQQDQEQHHTNGTITNGNHVDGDGEDLNGSGTATVNEEHPEEDEPLPTAAPEMERTVSQSHHATRSTRATDALGILAGAASADAELPHFPSAITVQLPITVAGKGNPAAPPPPALSTTQVDQDLALITQPRDAYNNMLLDHCLVMETLKWDNPAFSSEITPINLPAVQNQALIAAAMGGVPMSAQSSMGGASEMGGVPMNRLEGGSVGMRRTISGRGFRSRLV